MLVAGVVTIFVIGVAAHNRITVTTSTVGARTVGARTVAANRDADMVAAKISTACLDISQAVVNRSVTSRLAARPRVAESPVAVEFNQDVLRPHFP